MNLVTSAVMLRALLDETALGSRVSVFVPEGLTVHLDGLSLVVDGITALIQSSGAGAVLDGQGISRLFHLRNGASLSLSRIHLRNGGGVESGGALLLDSGSSAEIVRSSIADCSAAGPQLQSISKGGAAHLSGASNVTLIESNITNTSVLSLVGYAEGGAMFLTGSSSASIIGSSLWHLAARGGYARGGAFNLHDSSWLTVSYSSICHTTAEGEKAKGGVIWCHRSRVAFALSVIEDTSLTYESCWGGGGGALSLAGSSLTFSSSTICGTVATMTQGHADLWGGAVFLDSSSSALLMHSSMNSTRAVVQSGYLYGAVVAVKSSSFMSLEHCQVSETTATVHSGSGYGGVSCQYLSSNVSFLHSSIRTVRLVVRGGSHALAGGAYLWDGCHFWLNHSTISEIEVITPGSAVGVLFIMSQCSVTLFASTVENCSCTGGAGVSSISGSENVRIALTGVTLNNLLAVSTHAEARGGGMKLFLAVLMMRDSQITNCRVQGTTSERPALSRAVACGRGWPPVQSRSDVLIDCVLSLSQ